MGSRRNQHARALRSLAQLVLRAAAAAGLLGVATTSASSCSYIVDTSPEQCASDLDCQRFPGTACIRNACVGPQPGDCSATQQCIARHGEHWICRKSDLQCVPLLSQECTLVEGDWTDDDAVMFGSVLPSTGPDQSIGLPMENSIRLAVSDFDSLANGLPPRVDGQARRPVVLIGCSDASDSDSAVRAAKHLASLGVPAIIGAAFSGVTIKVATEATIPAGVLLMSPSATSTAITDLADDGLVWRTAPSDAIQATALAKLVPLIEEQVRDELKLQESDPVKVAIVHKGDAYGLGLATSLEQLLVFNGKAATQNGSQYDRIDYGDPDGTTNYAEAVQRVLAMAPHIVIELGTNEGVTDILGPVEGQWPQIGYFPRYLLSDGGEIEELWSWVGTDDELRRRILGTVPGSISAQYTSFRQQYLSKFGQSPSPDVFGTAGSYDALYLLAYAAVAAGDQPLTGAALAEGLARLIPQGTALDVGGGQMNLGFSLLQEGENADFNGASGPLDFDIGTGEAPSDIQIWCIPRDASGKAGPARGAGMFYDATTGYLLGQLACDPTSP